MFRTAGDAASANQLAEEHFTWAQKTARTFAAKYNVDPDDAESAAMEALIDATRSYAPERGPFRGYAYRLIQHKILDDTARPRQVQHDHTATTVAVERTRRALADDSRFNEFLDALTDPTDRTIIDNHYRGKMQITDIAILLGLTVTECSRRHTAALERLRRFLS